MNRFFIAVAFLLGLTRLAFSQTVFPPNEHVKASLIADVSAIRAGRPFMLGVLLEIEPHWHIYWTHPGDSGMPTAVDFKLPEGFVVTLDPFPVPKQFHQNKTETVCGYDTTVLLTAHVIPPTDLRLGTEIPIEASVSWLSCKEACTPGKATLSLPLKVADHTTPANVDSFQRHASNVRPERERPADLAGVQATIDPATHVATLNLKWEIPGTSIQLFPAAPEGVTISHVTVKKTENDQTTISMKIEVDAGQKITGNRVQVLVAWRDAEGHTKGWESTVPVK